MSCAVIILSYNTKDLLRNCLNSIYEKKWKQKFDIYVVDNASVDGSSAMVKKDFTEVSLIENKENLGFTKGNNQILKSVKADFYLLLNSDTEVFDGSLDNLVEFVNESDYGIASCKLVFRDGVFQSNAGFLPMFFPLFFWLSGLDDILSFLGIELPSTHLKENFLKGRKEVGWVSGSVMIIKREVIGKIGGLDEDIFMYGEDVEFCFRAKKAGFRVGWTQDATIMHIGGGSSKNPALKQWLGEFKGLLYIYKKYYGQIPAIFLRGLIYVFIAVRVIVFTLIGKLKIAQTYGKIFTSF